MKNEVIKHVINCYEEIDMKEEEENLKRYGYVKTSDCMWTKIYKKNNVTVVLNREYWSNQGGNTAARNMKGNKMRNLLDELLKIKEENEKKINEKCKTE